MYDSGGVGWGGLKGLLNTSVVHVQLERHEKKWLFFETEFDLQEVGKGGSFFKFYFGGPLLEENWMHNHPQILVWGWLFLKGQS